MKEKENSLCDNIQLEHLDEQMSVSSKFVKDSEGSITSVFVVKLKKKQ